MDPMTAMLIGSAIGLGKSELIDRPKEERQRKLAARTQELSPWTKLQAGPIQEADPFSSAFQMGTTGASMAAGSEKDAYEKLRKEKMDEAYLEYLKSKKGEAQVAAPAAVQMPARYSPWSVA